MDVRSENDNVAPPRAMTCTFANLVKDEFAFLLDRGFSLSGDGSEKVCYQSAKSVVCITWDNRSGELGVYMQPLHHADGEPPFSLRDLLAMEGEDVLMARSSFQVSEQDQLRPFLRRLADDVSKHASKALAGDRMYYRRLSEFRSGQARSFMKEMHLRQARAKAGEAWQRRDYRQAAEQYESIRDDLSVAELKKLAIAKDRVH